MGGPEELRRGNGRVKDPSGFVLDEFRIVLGVDFGANHDLFRSDFWLVFEIEFRIDLNDLWGPIRLASLCF